MRIRNHETGIDYVNTDQSLHFNSIRPRRTGPTWQSAYIWCLRYNDEVSAHLIRMRNDEKYAAEFAEEGVRQ